MGDGRLEGTWLHDILSVTWAHMEHARRRVASPGLGFDLDAAEAQADLALCKAQDAKAV